jgi:cellulose synthase/poly-beta-1,6-N-acetylglucosamine synthase-like glycosyltransferase
VKEIWRVKSFMVFVTSFSAALLLVPAIVLFVEVAFSLRRIGASLPIGRERRRVAVLMPAHNEALVIPTSLRSIIPQLVASDRLVVVADNCSDTTAAVARSEGVEVVVRTDPVRRGKGYALDFGVRYLEQDPPEVVIIIDADCLVAAGSIDTLVRRCAASQRPVQALHLMHAAKGAGLRTRIAEFAFVVKAQVRPTGLHRMGLPCQLAGTGMAFPWACIRNASLATGHIVEDLKIGVELAQTGSPPLFCPEALLTSTFAATREASQSQRTRWEHGHIDVILNDAPRLLATGIMKFDMKIIAMALDLGVPPLALLSLLNGVIWIAGALMLFAAHSPIPLFIASASLILIAVSVFISWRDYGRQVVSLSDLSFAVFYSVIKIPLYARFLVARQLNWVRSKRDGEK